MDPLLAPGSLLAQAAFELHFASSFYPRRGVVVPCCLSGEVKLDELPERRARPASAPARWSDASALARC